MSNTQSNTRTGLVPFPVSVDLTAKEGFLAKIVSDGGVGKAALPTAVSDEALYIIEKGQIVGEAADLTPLNPNANQRVYAVGTGSAGSAIVLSDPATPANAGKVEELPVAAGTYFSPGVAEEDFVDGQLVRFRPFPRTITVV